MVATQMKILRLFGMSAAEVSGILRQAKADGCPGLRLLERDGEFAVCVQVSAPTEEQAAEYCDKWVQHLRRQFGDAVYGYGESSLAEATLAVLLGRRRLLVAADESTGRLLALQFQELPHCEAAFDFGRDTYLNKEKANKIISHDVMMKKFPGDAVQAAACRAVLAMEAGQADYAVVYLPAAIGQGAFVLLADAHGAVACGIKPDSSDTAIANQMLNLVRRRVLNLKQAAGTISFKHGHDHPLLLVSEEGQVHSTTRFSLRKPRMEGSSTGRDAVSDFKGKSDETALRTARRDAGYSSAIQAAALDDSLEFPKTMIPDEPTGKIVFESGEDEEASIPSSKVPENLSHTQRLRTPLEKSTDDFWDALNVETAGPEAAAEARKRREKSELRDSLLDLEVPDFHVDPEALAAARDKDEEDERTGRTLTGDDFRQAATILFGGEQSQPDSAKDKQSSPQKSTLPEENNQGETYTHASAARSRSLEIIEKSERRQRRTVLTVLAILLLLLLGSASGIAYWMLHSTNKQPDKKNYGTSSFDTAAQDYLLNTMNQKSGIVGYLAFPGMDGFFLCTSHPDGEETASAVLQGTSYLGSMFSANTVMDCSEQAVSGMDSLQTVKENSGFTLYLADNIYRFKVVSVYYTEDSEEGQELSNYYDYLNFVTDTQMRSLFQTPVEIGSNAGFLTLISDSAEEGVRLCVTGRLIGNLESAQLEPSAITEADFALLTETQYRRRGENAPSTSELAKKQIAVFTAHNALKSSTALQSDEADIGSGSSSENLSQTVEEMQQATNQLLAQADTLLAGLKDVSTDGTSLIASDLDEGASGTMPEVAVPIPTAAPTAVPTATPTVAPTDAPTKIPESTGATPTPTTESTPVPTSESIQEPTAAPAVQETINVTMNGTAQTMDLVECLAMVATNELGTNAPAEAYKAQCVATHCWIISQGGYPSVLGTTPCSSATAAAQEVANVLVTYNGSVCFTPYFASASTGTASSADVWGSSRAYLQAVDSPYDKDYASNWNTNGSTSGTARFARDTVLQRVQEKLGIDLSGLPEDQWFTILSANQYGWVTKVQIGQGDNSTDCSGTWFRENLMARQSVTGSSLRSQCFTFTYDADLQCFIFDVYGYGHGCGMSQWGAIGYAKNGWDYKSILTHYFTGASITTY